MSRYVRKSADKRYEIAYGWDDAPMMGYYFQVFDREAVSDKNEEGVVISDGMCPGISRSKMANHLSTIEKWGVKKDKRIEDHLLLIALDQPI